MDHRASGPSARLMWSKYGFEEDLIATIEPDDLGVKTNSGLSEAIAHVDVVIVGAGLFGLTMAEREQVKMRWKLDLRLSDLKPKAQLFEKLVGP